MEDQNSRWQIFHGVLSSKLILYECIWYAKDARSPTMVISKSGGQKFQMTAVYGGNYTIQYEYFDDQKIQFGDPVPNMVDENSR